MPSVSVIEEIKERVDIVELISQHVSLKRAGRSHKGLCPFHSEKTPSFLVFPDKGNYHCFGCGANGDVFTFIMMIQQVDFAEALRLLAERAGVQVPERHGAAPAEDRHKERLFEVNAVAAQFFNHLLLHNDLGRVAGEYLNQRGISHATIESFQLGYSPDSWDMLSRFLIERGFTADEIFGGGLTVEREDGRRYDRFRGRLMFPVRDLKGRTTGFGARALGHENPKYLNTPQTPIFDKGGSLYGIDLARSPIKDADRVVVVEGYVDAVMAHQGGTKYVVACLGTALTERQVGLLKRLTKHLMLALDPDSAGDEATFRGLEVMREVFDKREVPVPNWRGMIRFERKLDADIRIVPLPRGKDPDEVIREDGNKWRELIENAQPLVDYYYTRLLSKADLSSAKSKEEVVEQLLPVLRELGDGVQQAHYLQRLSEELRVSERALAERLSARPDVISRPVRKETDRGQTGLTLDEYLISLFLRYSEARQHIWNVLPEELRHEASRQLLFALRSQQSLWTGPDGFAEGLEPAIAGFAARLWETSELAPELADPEVSREVAECIAELRRRNLRGAIGELAYVLREAEEGGDAEASRVYIAKHLELLAELSKYEHNSSKARVWRL